MAVPGGAADGRRCSCSSSCGAWHRVADAARGRAPHRGGAGCARATCRWRFRPCAAQLTPSDDSVARHPARMVHPGQGRARGRRREPRIRVRYVDPHGKKVEVHDAGRPSRPAEEDHHRPRRTARRHPPDAAAPDHRGAHRGVGPALQRRHLGRRRARCAPPRRVTLGRDLDRRDLCGSAYAIGRCASSQARGSTQSAHR